MCLNPIRLRSPAKRISIYGGQKLSLTVECGKCAECLNKKRSQWYFRTYQEVQSTLKQGGYIYFDTLTYSDKYLPHLSEYIPENYDLPNYIKNFSCFRHSDFKVFLKRLRRNLQYRFGCNKFKYFLTSEYGEDERYTHRPHYHILFYITAKVDPFEFSKCVSECWYYGRTDGIPYRLYNYVANHVYGYSTIHGNNATFKTISSVCNYVSKYITKSSRFTKELEKRLYALTYHIQDENIIKDIKHAVDMFHRQSQNFGIGYLDDIDVEKKKLIADNLCSMPDSKSVVKILPLPMYYKRKLFYQIKKHADGTRYWEYTDTGINHQNEYLLKSIDKQKQKHYDILTNKVTDRTELNSLLKGRTIEDYLLYKQFYQGRIRLNLNLNPLSFQTEMCDDEYNLDDWIRHISYSYRVNSHDSLEHYNFINDYIYYHNDDNCSSIHIDEFIKNNVFDENSDYEFRDFDKIDKYFSKLLKQDNDITQKTFDYLEDIKERFKIINNEYRTNL